MRTFDLAPLYRSTVGFDRLFSMLDGFEAAPGYPPYNIERTGENAYRISVAVAGFADNELSIEAKENTLTIKGEKKVTSEVKEEQFRRVERRYGSFSRSFSLPQTVDATRVSAEYKNGVLTVRLPLREEAKPRQIKVDIAAAYLQIKQEELRFLAEDSDLNTGEEIEKLRSKARMLTGSIFANLTPWQITQLARHPQRPYTLDYIPLVFTEFQELHGDRMYADDQAIVGGPLVGLDMRTFYLKDLTLVGCTAWDEPVFPNLVGYIERGEIRPLVARTFPLDEIADAQREFLEKNHVGNFVLIPPPVGQLAH